MSIKAQTQNLNDCPPLPILRSSIRLPDVPKLESNFGIIGDRTSDSSSSTTPVRATPPDKRGRTRSRTESNRRPKIAVPASSVPKSLLTYEQMFQLGKDEAFKSVAKKEWTDYFKWIKDEHPDEYRTLLGPAYTVIETRMASTVSKKDPDTDYYLITVNPRSGTGAPKLLKLTDKCLSKRWIIDRNAKWLYVLEQRSSESGKFHGEHAHILLERPRDERGRRYEWGKFGRELRNTFANVCGGPLHVDIKPVKNGTENRVIAYMMGTKKDPSKELAVRNTIEWRQLLGIQPYYQSADEDTYKPGDEYEPPEEEKSDDESDSEDEEPSHDDAGEYSDDESASEPSSGDDEDDSKEFDM